MSILITGATGTLGRALIRRLLAENYPGRIIAFSRDEVKQAALRQEFGYDHGPKLFLGDVRDAERLGMAMRGVSTVIHAAALKRVDAGAYSPSEMVCTNVIGTMNVVNAAILNHVGRVVVISSDKCVNATNIYGATKYLAECYAVAANAYGVPSGTRIAAVRYGNILGSRGSVVGLWRDQLKRGVPMTLTDPRMSRFVMTIEQACDLVHFALMAMQGGEVFLPVLPSAMLHDLALAVAPPSGLTGPKDPDIVWTGLRPGGEKLAESLLNEEEPCRTRLVGDEYYVVAPSQHEWTAKADWPGTLVSPDLTYRSDQNVFLSVGALRDLISKTEACRD